MTLPPVQFAELSLSSASSLAPSVDLIFWTLVVVGSGIVLLLGILILVFLVRYRRGSPASRAPLAIATWKLETGWIVATTVIFVGIFAWGAQIYLDEEQPPAGAMVIDVVARQWMWDIRQPNGRREFNTLHVPLNQAIVLRLASEDVIHSLFVPAFRLKQDVVPGKVINAWFTATRAGTYHLFCSQFCGTAHASMIGEVIAQTPEDYAAWLAAGSTTGAVADRGRRLAVQYGCTGCHAPGSTVHAPALESLAGHMVPLTGGELVRADDAYLRDSILEPVKQVAAGYAPVMPSYQRVIPESDLAELVAWLKSLGDVPVPPAPTRPSL